MPLRDLVFFPDPRLRQKALPVDAFGPALAALATDIADTLTALGAIGLTAPHIGVGRRVVVVRMTPGEAARTYVNPILLWSAPETETHEEGSVSMPGIRERIGRPARIRIGFQDLEGNLQEAEMAGFEAAVMLHEIDQLDGIFWIERLSRLKRERAVARFAKLKRRG